MRSDDAAVLIGVALAVVAFLTWGRHLSATSKISFDASAPLPGESLRYWVPGVLGMPGRWVEVFYKP